MLKNNKLITILIVLLSTNMTYAGIHHNQSGPNDIMSVGISAIIPYGPNQSAGGEPGVSIKDVGKGIKVEFATLTTETASGGADSRGIYTVQSNNLNRDLGVFHFAKITDANVYFGDWAKTAVMNDATYQSYYVGKNVTTRIPINSATYSVTGISQYDGNNLLSGTFHVDFAHKKIHGFLANSIRTLSLENGNLYHINNQLLFSMITKEDNATGIIEGAFFGTDANVLAGIIEFSSDHTKDIGFGGNKNIGEFIVINNDKNSIDEE